jgi:hypothetical protein
VAVTGPEISQETLYPPPVEKRPERFSKITSEVIFDCIYPHCGQNCFPPYLLPDPSRRRGRRLEQGFVAARRPVDANIYRSKETDWGKK